MEGKPTHILYTVLNWGLGHATRSIPVISELIRQGARVSLAGEGDSFHLLKNEFPDLDAYEVKGIAIYYPERIPLVLSMVFQSIHIKKSIRSEHLAFIKLARALQPDAIISDNRYGAYVPGIPSVLICHQLRLKAPVGFHFTEPFLFYFYRKFLRPFSQIWVPDVEGDENLTGELSHHPAAVKALKPVFIGPLSRLKDSLISDTQTRYEIFAIISGPEPQRSVIERKLIQQLKGTTFQVLLVTGKPKEDKSFREDNIDIVPNLSAGALKYHFIHSKFIICRAGHSTLMDLCAFNRTAIAIPTPGQTEQEYLVELHAKRNKLVIYDQNNIDILSGLKQLPLCTAFKAPVNELIAENIRHFLQNLKK